MHRYRLLSLLVFAFAILFFLFFQFCKHNSTLGPVNPFAEDPYDAVGSFSIQLALLAAGLALLRAFRPYSNNGSVRSQALLLLRSATVALLAVLVTLIADALGLARAIAGSGISTELATLTALLVGMAGLNLLALGTLLKCARSDGLLDAWRRWGGAILILAIGMIVMAIFPLSWRDTGITGALFTIIVGILYLFLTVWAIARAIFPELDLDYEDLFDDAAAIYIWLKKHVARFSSAFNWLEKMAGSPVVQQFASLFNPRRHRWNLVVLLAAGAGLFLAIAEVTQEGLPGSVRMVMLVLGVFISMEITAIVVGHILLGKYLGIYRAE